MLATLAQICYRRRRAVVAAWLALLVLAVIATAGFGGDLRDEFGLPGSDSQRAADVLEAGGFVDESGLRGQVVVAADQGVEDPGVSTAVSALLAQVGSVEGVSVEDPWSGTGGRVAPGGTVALADVAFGDVPLEVGAERAAEIADLRDAADLPAGVRVELGGQIFWEEPEFSSEGIGLLGAAVILLVAFGSVLAMGLPILTALFGIACGMAIVLLAANVMDVPSFGPAAVAMVSIGVGIDYALFLVTRYREELAAGRHPEGAVVRAVATAGRAVLFAGTTVVIALAGLLVVGLSATRSLALAISAGVLMVMLASLTLLPALLGFVGRNIDRLSIGRRRAAAPERSVWYRWSRLVQRRPLPVALVGLAVILVLTAPMVSMRLGFGDAGNRPETDTARRAYDLVGDAFGPGFNGPVFIAASLSGDPDVDRGVVADLEAALEADPGVAFASPVTMSESGAVAVAQAFPTTAPQDAATSELVQRLRAEVLPEVAAPGTELSVGGSIASAIDFADLQSDRMPGFIAAVLAVSFVVLMAVFRSVAVAAKAVVLNLLSIGAAYGVLVAVFQWGWGAGALGLGEPGPIEAWAPMMLFAILFGLSMDYEVFLLSRIKEEYDASRDNATAVANGLARTARLITAAAAIMIFVFGGFILSADRALQLFGFGLAVAILVDVSVVRLLLVPSTMELLGDRNWWFPRILDRVLPRMAAESAPSAPAAGSGLERTPTLEEHPASPSR